MPSLVNDLDTVDDINPALPLRTLNYGNYGILFITGFISSTVLSDPIV